MSGHGATTAAPLILTGVQFTAPPPPHGLPQQPKKRGRKPLVLTAAERAAKLEREREHNRMMQAQRRQQHKVKAQAVHSQYEESVLELEQAQAARSGLQHINSLLDSLLLVREEYVDILMRCKAEDMEGQSRDAQPSTDPMQRSGRGPAAAGSADSFTSPSQWVREMLSGGIRSGGAYTAAENTLPCPANKPGSARATREGAAGSGSLEVGSLPPLSLGLEGSLGDLPSLGSIGSLPLKTPSQLGPDWFSVADATGIAADALPLQQQQQQTVMAPGQDAPAQPRTPTTAATASSMQGGFGPASRSSSEGSSVAEGCVVEWTLHHGFRADGDESLREYMEEGERGSAWATPQGVELLAAKQGFIITPAGDPGVVEEVKACTPQQFVKGWQTLAGRIRDVLIEYDMTRNPSTLLRLKPLMESWGVTMMLMLRYKPSCVQRLFASSAEHGILEHEALEKWESIAAAMALTPGQRQRYVREFETYRSRAQGLREQREQAVARIQQASIVPTSMQGLGLNGIMSSYLQVADATAELASAPAQEFAELLDYMSRVGRVLTPLQKARVLAMSHPHFPEMFQIAEAVKRLEPRSEPLILQL
ncbi:hypothetical protein N2152v2_003066 [Parachlorella kessleri]